MQHHAVMYPTQIFTASTPNGHWASGPTPYHCLKWQALCGGRVVEVILP